MLVYLCSSSSRCSPIYLSFYSRTLSHCDPIFSKALYLHNDEELFDLQLVYTALSIHESQSRRTETLYISNRIFLGKDVLECTLSSGLLLSEFWILFFSCIRFADSILGAIFDFPRVIRFIIISWSFVRFQTSVQRGLELPFISLALSLFWRVFCVGSMVYLTNSDDDNIFVEEKYHGVFWM